MDFPYNDPMVQKFDGQAIEQTDGVQSNEKSYCPYDVILISRVSCQKGPTRHAYAWQIGPFWQDTLDI